MSFASEVKKELLDISELEDHCEKALLFGILQAASEVAFTSSGKKVVIKCTILNTLKVIIPIIKRLYNTDITLGVQDESHLSKRRYYLMEITDKADEIINDFYLMPFIDIPSHNPITHNVCCKAAFVRGMFIAKGSINDPRKECYHFEISSIRADALNLVKKFLSTKHIDAKILERKNRTVLYIKKSEEISNTLAYIGAPSGVLYFEDQRIMRDVANMANRMTNCDIANEIKCTANCDKQLDAITYIKDKGYFDKMSARLQATAALREEYPDSSYEELSYYSENIMGKYISKSGITHCLRDLMKFYEDLKNKLEK